MQPISQLDTLTDYSAVKKHVFINLLILGKCYGLQCPSATRICKKAQDTSPDGKHLIIEITCKDEQGKNDH